MAVAVRGGRWAISNWWSVGKKQLAVGEPTFLANVATGNVGIGINTAGYKLQVHIQPFSLILSDYYGCIIGISSRHIRIIVGFRGFSNF